ncbi:MAG: MATE family efflux transporter [Spirochaetales bacterium]
MKDLTEGPEGSLILRFALPMLIGNLFQQFYNMVDSWVVGNFVGKLALGAVGAAFPIVFFMIALTTGITMGANILIAQAFGAKQMEQVRAIIDTTYLVLLWAGGALSVAGVLGTEAILRVMQIPQEVFQLASDYLRIIFGGSIVMLGYNGISAILRGLGDSKTPLYMLILATLLNIVLDLLFVLGFGWGTRGVAWATVISQGVSVVGSVWYLNRTHPVLRTNFRHVRFHSYFFRLSLKLGVPTGAQQMLVSFGIMFMTAIVNSFGSDVLAGFAAASRIDSLAGLPAMNIGLAISSFTGQNLGARQPERARKGFIAALRIAFSITASVVFLILLFNKELVGIFTKDPEVIRIGSQYLRIVAPFHFVFTLMFITNGVIRGAGAVMVPFLTTLLAMWAIRVPAALYFSTVWGVPGLWYSMPTGWIVGTLVSLLYYRSGRWTEKALLRPSGTP